MADEPRKVRYTCPACDKVGYYPLGQPIVCKSCGAYADPALATAAPAQPPAPATPAAATMPPPAQPPTTMQQSGEGTMLLAVLALVAGIASIGGVWATPMSFLIAVAAIAAGAVALSRRGHHDGGAQAMAVIGIVLGGLALVAILFFASVVADSGSWWTWDWSWWQPPPQHSSYEYHQGIDIPFPAWPLAVFAVAAAAAWRRR